MPTLPDWSERKRKRKSWGLGAPLDEEKRELSRALVDRVVVRDRKVERVE